MSQEEVFNFLKRSKTKWFTGKKIAEKLRASTGSVTNNLNKLRDSGQIHHKFVTADSEVAMKRKVYAYRFKR